MWWDVRAYYKTRGHFGPPRRGGSDGASRAPPPSAAQHKTAPDDAISDGLLAFNLLALPAAAAAGGAADRSYHAEGLVAVRLDEAGYLLEQYLLTWRNITTRLRQHGDLESCVR